MKNIITILKKELSRVFKDKRLIFSTIIMPGLMIFLLYSLMGNAITSFTEDSKAEIATIAAVNMNEDVTNYLDTIEYNYELKEIEIADLNSYKEKVLDGTIDYIIIFPENFKADVLNKLKPDIETYYNPGEDISSDTNNTIYTALQAVEAKYLIELNIDSELFTVNIDNNGAEVFDKDKVMGKAISMLLPFLIIIFLFSGAMSVAPESIAGDKERGTMATLLVTPIKRSEIAWGKIIALSIISVLSAVSSFIGIIASLPKLMGFSQESGISEIYGFTDYLLVFVILLVTVIFIVGMISVVSALAKNMKEANTFILPLYFVSMGVGISTMFSQGASDNYFVYLIPMYGSLQCLVGIFTFDYNIICFLIVVASNLVYTGALIFLLSRMFNNEKIMFSK